MLSYPAAWQPIARGTKVNYDGDLDSPTVEVKSISEVGSNDRLHVLFWGSSSKHSGGAGGINILFSAVPKYSLDWCGVSGILPTLPDAVNKVWQITKAPGNIRVLVNGKEVVNIESEGLCRYSHSPGVWNRKANSLMIPSDDTASDSYRLLDYAEVIDIV